MPWRKFWANAPRAGNSTAANFDERRKLARRVEVRLTFHLRHYRLKSTSAMSDRTGLKKVVTKLLQRHHPHHAAAFDLENFPRLLYRCVPLIAGRTYKATTTCCGDGVVIWSQGFAVWPSSSVHFKEQKHCIEECVLHRHRT